MTISRILPAPGQTRPEGSFKALLAECGFQEEPTYLLVCRDTYCDTLDGRLLAGGFRLFHRDGGRGRPS